MAKLILFNKPYGVLSQFTDASGRPTLAHHINVAKVYPAGRLDHDSEGLLLLTDDGQLQHRISHPRSKQPKYYWVQVEGLPDESALQHLRAGVQLKDGLTAPAQVGAIPAPLVWQREPPIRDRVNQPTSWLEVVIHEGRNRQVRRMTAAVGHPTLRLIRHRIGHWSLGELRPGEWRSEVIHLPASPATKLPPGPRSSACKNSDRRRSSRRPKTGL